MTNLVTCRFDAFFLSTSNSSRAHRLFLTQAEEIPNFTQEDLFDDDVMLLDGGASLFVWDGSSSTPQEREAGLKTASEYLAKTNRSSVPVIQVKSGQEPLPFTSLFMEWNEAQTVPLFITMVD